MEGGGGLLCFGLLACMLTSKYGMSLFVSVVCRISVTCLVAHAKMGLTLDYRDIMILGSKLMILGAVIRKT